MLTSISGSHPPTHHPCPAQPTAILELPTEVDVATRPDDTTNLSLPNQQYSSDHLAIMAEFQYKTRE